MYRRKNFYTDILNKEKFKLFSATIHFYFTLNNLTNNLHIKIYLLIHSRKTSLTSKIPNITPTIFTPHIIYLSIFNIFLFFFFSIPSKQEEPIKKSSIPIQGFPQPFKRPIECRPARFGAVCSPIQVIDSSESLEQRLSIIVADPTQSYWLTQTVDSVL